MAKYPYWHCRQTFEKWAIYNIFGSEWERAGKVLFSITQSGAQNTTLYGHLSLF